MMIDTNYNTQTTDAQSLYNSSCISLTSLNRGKIQAQCKLL